MHISTIERRVLQPTSQPANQPIRTGAGPARPASQSEDGVLAVQQLPHLVVVLAHATLEQKLAALSLDERNLSVDDEDAARKLGCHAALLEHELQVRELRLAHEHGGVVE
jgi:hypothetical protein